ncbi:hypothetical protein [Nostoc sp. LEGE 12450]|uniref:hypothetical protein n=1 Tax=Nostoc sp. LEGE 12450 TaxID=1828643 RepID=UPI0018816E89|nr:hypothetical protein [Nostoc sp. LEGE 12450]MBE8990653.1 hypothetical protein [Nostoc sp. LEGE 12450]
MAKFKEFLKEWISLFSSVIAYQDSIYGYPQSRWLMLGMLLLGFGFWIGVFTLFFSVK